VTILTVDNAKWLVATLAIPLAIPAALGLVSYEYQKAESERQINDARLRLYTELLSKREEADTAVRRGIFDKVLEKYLKPTGQDLQAKIVALDLLALNFHDSLDLSPLFWQLHREVERAPRRARDEFAMQLTRIANGVKDRQILALEFGNERNMDSHQPLIPNEAQVMLPPSSQEPSIDADFSFPDPAEPSGPKQTRHLTLTVKDDDPARSRVYAVVTARGREQGEKDQTWGFWIDTFDFPMVNFTRVSRSERFAVVLLAYQAPTANPSTERARTARVKMLYFPSARVGVKDKPFIDDVISDLVHGRR